MMRASVYLAITISVVFAFLLACSPAAPTAAPAKPTVPAPAATTAAKPPVAATSAPAAATSAPAASTAAPAPKIKRGGVLKIAVGGEPQPNLDPHQNQMNAWGYEAMYGGYMQYVYNEAAKKWEIKPFMVESWSNPDPKSLVLKLKKGVSFHDGSPWNAEAAKWNLDRHRGATSFKKSSYKNELEPINSIDIVDEHTIKLNLKVPSPALLALLSDGSYRAYMLSMESTKKNGDEWAETHPVGAGPMKFVDWKRDDRIILTKWDKYWENGEDGKPLPYLDGAELIQARDLTTKALNLRVGMFDVSDKIQPKDLLAIKQDPNFTVVDIGAGNANYYFFNLKDPLWGKNPKLRQAAEYALDTETLAKTLGMGVGEAVYYHWSAGMLGYNESVPKYTFSLDKSKQLMKEAGMEGGTAIDLSVLSSESNIRVAEMMKSMWEKVGIQTTISPYERTAVVNKWLAGEFQVGLSGKTFGEVDPDILSWRLVTGGDKNFTGGENKVLDDCMKEGRETIEPDKRQKVYERCQTLVYEDAAYGILWNTPDNSVYSKKLKGYTVTLSNNAIRLTRAWLDK